LSTLKILLLFLAASFSFLGAVHSQGKPFQNNDRNGEENKIAGCGGVERWDEKVLTDALASQVNYNPIPTTLDSLIHIPTVPNASAKRMQGIEFQVYKIRCNITVKRNESDEDYHLILVDGNESMIGEVPDPTCPVAATSAHLGEFIASRNWVSTHIGLITFDVVNIPLVEVTGVAFVDVPHGQTGEAPNHMEIHPILNIQFADNSGMNGARGFFPAFSVTVSPIAFSETTDFHLSSAHEMFGSCKLEIFSLNGERVNDLSIPADRKNDVHYTFHRNTLPNGLYIYRLLNNGLILYEGKIILQ
jgi:hypothetical protein